MNIIKFVKLHTNSKATTKGLQTIFTHIRLKSKNNGIAIKRNMDTDKPKI